jgi:hypothetical protein
MKRKTGYNPKRRFEKDLSSALLDLIAQSVRYGGYPMPATDPFARQVLLRWRQINE